MGTLKPQSTVIGTLAVDGWTVTFGTARRGLPRPLLAVPSVTIHPSTAIVYQFHIITIITFAL